jgi:phosphonate transport system substrate-binding protein
LRFVTYLSPGLPVEIFEAIASRVGRKLGCSTSLEVDARASGPELAGNDPFSAAKADVGFMCAPPFIWLRDRPDPPVELLGAAPVFEDDRAGGEPVYFSEVIVRRDNPSRTFEDLARGTWAYNDERSLSGYYGLLERFAEHPDAEGMRFLCSGSHLDSIDLVAGGEANAAAIDSNVLSLHLARNPELRARLRVVESLGPFPIQPVVVRSRLDERIKTAVRECLLSWGSTAAGREELSGLGLMGFAPVDETHYAAEQIALEACRERRPIHTIPEGDSPG